MKERYSPTEPIKVGIEATVYVGKTVFEVAKPYLKRKMARDVGKFLSLFDGTRR